MAEEVPEHARGPADTDLGLKTPPKWQTAGRAACRPEVWPELEKVHGLSLERACALYEWVLANGTAEEEAYLGRFDRYFLLTVLLNRRDLMSHGTKGNRWLYARCREVEAEPDDHLDLWAREHGKSSLLTFGGSIQEILRDPEVTIGIFSHTRPIAKGFLRQVKAEFEGNAGLKALYPDVLWQNPRTEAQKWSEDEGITVKRQSNPKEATVEAHGLVDGQPTGKHYRLRIYDDVVTRESVTTPEMIQKVTEARELSDNLGSRGGREWNIGTRYHFGDTYSVYLGRGVFKPRIYPATHNGKLDGEPVFLTEKEWGDKKRKQPSQVAAQMLQNPLAGEDVMFRAAWLRRYWTRPRTLNVYILVDPSKGSPSRRSDRTGMAVIGIDANHNKYLLDGYRHRMSLADRWKALKGLHKVWTRAPGVQAVYVGYERYGLQSDIEHFEQMMQIEDYHFAIDEVAWPKDHAQSKADRVERLVPDLRDGRFWLPAIVHRDNQSCTWTYEEEREVIVYRPLQARPKVQREMEERLEGYRNVRPIKRINEARQVYDVTADLIEEALFFPAGPHDDLIDAVARIYDVNPVAPTVVDPEFAEYPTFIDT